MRLHEMEVQEQVNETYTKYFGRTPLTLRLDDIQGEFEELYRYTDMRNLREEAGDLLGSIIQLCTECGWDFRELIKENLEKIKRRHLQYRSLGRKIKVAILGGAFDPIHVGHIEAAQFVLNTSKTFDEVWLMPCYKHMNGKDLTPAEHRLEMCKLASNVDGRIKVFDYEITNKLGGETYNFVNRLLQEDFAKDQYDFSMIIGQDNANTFDSWVNYEHLERMMRFVVVSRKGVEPTKEAWYLKAPHIYLQDEGEAISNISSSEIRYKLIGNDAADQSFIFKSLNEEVVDYIFDNLLYREKKEK